MKCLYWLFLLLVFLLAACQTQAEITPTATIAPSTTSTATVTASATIEPTMTSTVTRTPRPTKPTNTPTMTPIPLSSDGVALREGDELPELEPITLENLDQLQEIAQWGYGQLYDVRLTPDEKQVVAATSIGFFWFDAITLEELNFVPYAFEDHFYSIKLSPSTESAAYCSNRQVNFVATVTGLVSYSIGEHMASDLWFAPNGNELFVLLGDFTNGTVKIWNISLQQWEDQEIETFQEMAFSADGKTFITRLGGYLNLYTSGGKDPIEIDVFPIIIGEVDLSDDGRYIAVGGEEDVNVKVWDTVEQKMIFERCLDKNGCIEFIEESAGETYKQARPDLRSGPSSFVSDIKITPNGKYLIVSTSEDYGDEIHLYRFNLEKNMLIMKERLFNSGGKLITFSNSRRYITWGYTTFQSRFIYEAGIQANSGNDSNTIVLPPEDSVSVYVDSDNIVHLIDNETSVEFLQRAFNYDISRYKLFHKSSKIVFGNGEQGQPPIIWNYETDEIITFEPSDWNLYTHVLEVSSDDQFIYYCEWESPCSWVSASTGEILAEGWWGIVTFHPEEPIAIYHDDEIKEYVVAYYTEELTFEQIITLPDCYASVLDNQVGFLPNSEGYYCATSEKLRIYDAEGTYRDILTGEEDEYSVRPVGIYADGSMYIVTEDTQVKFYDMQSGKVIAVIELPSYVLSVELSADEKYLVTCENDRIYRLWGVPANP